MAPVSLDLTFGDAPVLVRGVCSVCKREAMLYVPVTTEIVREKCDGTEVKEAKEQHGVCIPCEYDAGKPW